MKRGVIYMLYGGKHALQVVTSLYSLRQHWDGPVSLLCGYDSDDSTSLRLGERLAKEDRLDVTPIPFKFVRPRRRNSGYYNKTRMHEFTPYESTVFFDADTLIVGSFDELFPTANEMVLTQFATWKSDGRRVKRRCEDWRGICPVMVDRMQGWDFPAINTGVLGFTHETKFMDAWKKMTRRRIGFICDEIAAQLIFPDYSCRVLDHRFNSSVVYSVDRDYYDKANCIRMVDGLTSRIWHGHGSKFFRKETGRVIFRPYYDACIRENIAGIADWTPYGPGKKPLVHAIAVKEFT